LSAFVIGSAFLVSCRTPGSPPNKALQAIKG
jgi:hypothetical protein